MNEPTVTSRNSALRDNPNVENYLHEAALVADAPSGTAYYNGNGQRVTNLGIHEHWNDPTHKQYSRNLGGGEGIELVRVGAGTDAPSAGQSPYTDVPAGAWYADAANFCREQNLMNGTSAATFSPTRSPPGASSPPSSGGRRVVRRREPPLSPTCRRLPITPRPRPGPVSRASSAATVMDASPRTIPSPVPNWPPSSGAPAGARRPQAGTSLPTSIPSRSTPLPPWPGRMAMEL